MCYSSLRSGHTAQRHCHTGRIKPASASTCLSFIQKRWLCTIQKTFGQTGSFFLHKRLLRFSKRRSYLRFQNFQQCPDPSTARSWLYNLKIWRVCKSRTPTTQMRHEFSPEMTVPTKDIQRKHAARWQRSKTSKLGAVWSKFSSALHDAGDLKSDTEVVLTAVKCNGSSAWQFKNDMNSSVMATRFEY